MSGQTIDNWQLHGRLRSPASNRCLTACGVSAFLVVFLSLGGCRKGDVAFIDAPVEQGADIPNEDSFLQPVSVPEDISSTFGPRWKTSESRDDFHRGIDFFGERGDPIFAIGDGLVTGVHPTGSTQFPNGGNSLVIEHQLATPFEWQGVTVERLYAVYLHLDEFLVVESDAVMAGQQVATMGDSGTTDFVHLHFEIRLQTVCSLEFQLANPDASCAQYGFDPHVHPFEFIGGANTDDITIGHLSGTPFIFTYEATWGDLDLNEIRTDLGTLNFNRRTGIDASSTETLDDFDYGWVRVVPAPFTSSSETIRYEFHFPERPQYVELTDIHGRGLRRTFSN